MRAYRARRRRGDIVVRSIVVSPATIETLIDGGLLPGWDADNPDAVAQAVDVLLRRLQTLDRP
jgi:hypothetical protein